MSETTEATTTEAPVMINASTWQNHWEQAVEHLTGHLKQHLLYFQVPEGSTNEAVMADFHVKVYGYLIASQKTKEALEAAGGEITKEALMDILASQAILFESPVPAWVDQIGKPANNLSRRALQHML